MGAACSGRPGSSSEVKIFGMAASMNCMGPVLLAMDLGVGGLEICDLTTGAHLKPEFLAMNPFHHVPVMKDGPLEIGESGAILRYLATSYKPQYYPHSDPTACARIDFAMESFVSDIYEGKMTKSVYVVMGFSPAPPDQAKVVADLVQAVDTWVKHFLSKGKFVNGNSISIADFKVVPFLFAAIQPVMESKIKLKLPQRATKYVEDFVNEVASSTMLKVAGGYSIKEYCASKH